eukprot:CAMPEP_0194400626 /NCGR_PEP_ID=MMETSP0174-20130528/127337_1 /TAXON_ID=216777 /ORGANISM="Proboscia alata, Strain PI-D3" /LENGTH=509 /DNA_ID=CAMNT_0039197201 /DNA_START=205 /DNA_END=1734 /DNA_ORIENTATION=+
MGIQETPVWHRVAIRLLSICPLLLSAAALSSGTSSILGAKKKAEQVATTNANSDTNNQQPHILRQIPRVLASDFDPNVHYYRSSRNNPLLRYETPVIIEGALSPAECDTLCDTIVAECGSLKIDLQRKRSGGRSNIYNLPLEQAFEAMMQSKHGDATFAFCEGLLDGDLEEKDEESASRLANVRKTLSRCREKLFRRKDATNDMDWFECFPTGAKPSDFVILAGEGATSTLHRDPFEWTGTSVCLEGSKIWRFAPPPGALLLSDDNQEDLSSGSGSDDSNSNNASMDKNNGVSTIDKALRAYRLDSVAWNGNNDDIDNDSIKSMTLSAGWQSNLSFYAHRNDTNNKDDGVIRSAVPMARELDEMEYESGLAGKRNILGAVAADITKLCPNVEKNIARTLWSGVQHPGDLIVIPAYWWHQTYALEPSLAVASQRCGGTRDAGRVVAHILETAELLLAMNEENKEDLAIPTLLQRCGTFEDETPENVVSHLFDYLAKMKKKNDQMHMKNKK